MSLITCRRLLILIMAFYTPPTEKLLTRQRERAERRAKEEREKREAQAQGPEKDAEEAAPMDKKGAESDSTVVEVR